MESYHIESGWRSVLSHSFVFDTMMEAVGYTKAMRTMAREYIRARGDARILDIGCGTSLVLRYLPGQAVYEGFDINPKYVDSSIEKFSLSHPNAKFRIGSVSMTNSFVLGRRFDHVLAISLLHHLSDREAKEVFEVAQAVLDPGGTIVTYDPVEEHNTGFLNRLMNKLDRGSNIRASDQYRRLVPDCFVVEQFVRRGMCRLPFVASHIMICTRK